jgi:hypothetical protein
MTTRHFGGALGVDHVAEATISDRLGHRRIGRFVETSNHFCTASGANREEADVERDAVSLQTNDDETRPRAGTEKRTTAVLG